MREPGDGEALPASGRVLDQITLARAIDSGVAYQTTYAVELVVARKDEGSSPPTSPNISLLLKLVNELADEIEDAIPRPNSIPQVVSRES